jgi:peptidoglycan/xylan/chitin deacetylase (PgdA/CDA1 family)
MSRRRFDERPLFAILLLVFGIVLPLLSAFSTPELAHVAASPLPTARVVRAMDNGRLTPPSISVGTGDDGRPTDEGRPTAAPIVLTPVSQPLPTERAPGLPLATLTNTPEPLPAVPGPADGAPDTFAGGPPPILMYHYIRTVDQASDPLGYDLSITPELFEQHMAWLHDQGYTTMRMDAVARCLRGEARCPARAVALTFDDGYEDAFTTVVPTLRRYGFTATFFIISGIVGQPGYMSWEQLAALRDAGMEIGAHTIDHLDLTSLDLAESERQITQSKADLERELKIGIVSFCYPTGLYNAAIEEQVRAAGYTSATTTRWDGDYSDLAALPRRRISGGTALDGFAAIVQGY